MNENSKLLTKLKHITLEDHNQRVSIYSWGTLYLVFHFLSNQILGQWKDSPLKHHREGGKRVHQRPIFPQKNRNLGMVEEVPLPIQKLSLVAEDTTTVWTSFQIASDNVLRAREC